MTGAPSPLVRVPPPLLFGATVALGLLLQRKDPVPLLPHRLLPYTHPAFLVLLVAGVLLAGSALAAFVRRRTTLKPFGRPTALVTSGPFRWSRNPMYLALTLVVLSIAIRQDAAWPAILLLAPLLLMHAVVIPHEERVMETVYGEEYCEDCRRVRRWL